MVDLTAESKAALTVVSLDVMKAEPMVSLSAEWKAAQLAGLLALSSVAWKAVNSAAQMVA